MNGVHDLGGMQGFGPIHTEPDEPVFHEEWEGRMFAINRSVGAWRRWNIDAGRHEIELFPAADYLRMSYYEKWLMRNISLLVKHGLVTAEEMASGRAAPGSQKPEKPPPRTGAPYLRPEANLPAAFHAGDRIRARNLNPPGHTRLPRYVRGREGTVLEDRGIFVFPDTNAHFLGEHPQHLYSVRFAGRELWGEEAPERDFVYLDLWESYLEHP